MKVEVAFLGYTVLNTPYGLRGRKATLKWVCTWSDNTVRRVGCRSTRMLKYRCRFYDNFRCFSASVAVLCWVLLDVIFRVQQVPVSPVVYMNTGIV